MMFLFFILGVASTVAVKAEPCGFASWDCKQLSLKNLTPAGEVDWTRLNCTGSFIPEHCVLHKARAVGPMVFNVIRANLQSPGVRGVPLEVPQVASMDPKDRVKPLSEIAAIHALDLGDDEELIAGVNGGYFWRTDSESFFDDVCLGKLRSDALRQASDVDPNAGVSDNLMLRDGQVLGSNCNKLLNSRPTALILKELNGSQSTLPRIVVMDRGSRLPDTVQDAIASGPNLVSLGPDHAPHVDIVGDNVNIVEYNSNTGIGLRKSQHGSEELLLVTIDGHHGCPRKDTTCGIDAEGLAFFMKTYLGVHSAMGMDQGGSTTMWVKGEPNQGIVSNPGSGERSIFNGLFIKFTKSTQATTINV